MESSFDCEPVQLPDLFGAALIKSVYFFPASRKHSALNYMSHQTEEDTRLQVLQRLELHHDPEIWGSHSVRLDCPGYLVYGAGASRQTVYFSRDRMSHLLDTVLSSLQDAPKGTFEIDKDDRMPFAKGQEFLRTKVAEYLSRHTLESIAEPAPEPVHGEYVFPEDLEGKILTIQCEGTGHYYKSLRGATDTAVCAWTSKKLDSEHDCSEKGLCMRPVLGAHHDEANGTTTLEVCPLVRLCSRMKGEVPPELRQSFVDHMTEFANSDDPQVARLLKSTSKVSRGDVDLKLQYLSHEWADEWLKKQNLTCDACTRKTARNDLPLTYPLECKYFQSTPVSADEILQGSQVALEGIEAIGTLSPREKKAIRGAITEAIEAIKDSRPENTTYAQWSQALAETTRQLGHQMWIETMSRNPPYGAPETEEVAQDELNALAHAEVVSQSEDEDEGPPDPFFVVAHHSHSSPMSPYTTTGQIKVYGELREPRASSGRYLRTEGVQSRWIPIAGMPDPERQLNPATTVPTAPTAPPAIMSDEGTMWEEVEEEPSAPASGRRRRDRIRRSLAGWVSRIY